MAPQPPDDRRSTASRALLPFWVALAVGVLVLARQYHQRHAAQTRLSVQVTIEGQPPEDGFGIEVDGVRQDLGDPMPIGFAKIRIHAPNAEPRTIERFIWYGVTELGTVDLSRSRGSLMVTVTPPPERYELSGKRGSWTNVTGSFENITAGNYELTSRFGELSRRASVRVNGNQTERLNLAAEIGALELVAEPGEGEFELWSSARNDRRTGTFPATFPWLPTGPYQLVAKRPGYQREQKVEVRRNETNRVVVKFVYGSAKVITTPQGATVTWAGTETGTTPASLSKIVPGRYPLEVKLAGYDRVSKEVDVEGEATAEINLTLVNTRYREAMESAYQNRLQNRFAVAVDNLEAALAAQPGDTAATKMLPGIRARAFRDRAEAAAQNGDFQGALSALETALKALPDDPDAIALQSKYRTAKAEADQKQTEARFKQWMDEMTTAARQKDFEKALGTLKRIRTEFPDRPGLAEMEAALQKDQQTLAAETAAAKREEELSTRMRQFQAAWDRGLAEEKDVPSFTQTRWKTVRSATEVRAALVRLRSENSRFNFMGLGPSSPDFFTAKMGEKGVGSAIGAFYRIGAVTREPGNTQIVMMLIDYSGGVPVTNEVVVQKQTERFRADLSSLLGAEVK